MSLGRGYFVSPSILRRMCRRGDVSYLMLGGCCTLVLYAWRQNWLEAKICIRHLARETRFACDDLNKEWVVDNGLSNSWQYWPTSTVQ